LKVETKQKEEYDRDQAVRIAEELANGVKRDAARRESYATMRRREAEAEERARSPAGRAARCIMRHCDLHARNTELTISELQGGLVNTQYGGLLNYLVHHSHFGKFDANNSATLSMDELTSAIVKYLDEHPEDAAIATSSRPETREKKAPPATVD
jgi:hypothetical protein